MSTFAVFCNILVRPRHVQSVCSYQIARAASSCHSRVEKGQFFVVVLLLRSDGSWYVWLQTNIVILYEKPNQSTNNTCVKNKRATIIMWTNIKNDNIKLFLWVACWVSWQEHCNMNTFNSRASARFMGMVGMELVGWMGWWCSLYIFVHLDEDPSA